MHLLVQETRLLDEAQAAVDLDQTSADVVILSFSDSDLGAAASAWAAMGPQRPSLRLASLARLRHPMSVDVYLDRVVSGARCVVVRVLGGVEYWRYGVEEFFALCRDRGIALAMLSGDGRHDPALAGFSTVSPEQRQRMESYFSEGGPDNLRHAIAYGAHLGGMAQDDGRMARTLEPFGVHEPMPDRDAPRAVIVFYRAHLLAGDMTPIDALAVALRPRGMDVATLHVASLKNPECAAFVAHRLRQWRPSIVLNATAFSARQGDVGSPLQAAGAPVLQLVLAGSSRDAWAASSRGLSQTDLAMTVVLPELDGSLLTGAISFKAERPADPALQYARVAHVADPDGIALAAERALGWASLAATPRGERKVALILSDYPGGGQCGHAVGLDTLASVSSLLDLLREEGFDAGAAPFDVHAITDAAATPFTSLNAYHEMFVTLPASLRDRITAAWGEPVGPLRAIHAWHGRILVALQPDRGSRGDRKSGYHDPDLPPCHAYVAFYLWLRASGIQAIVHLGAHGTLEWLPGKSASLSAECAPRALLGGLPVIYPFIVNNPGEAAAAKRRLGAVTIGHLTPPLRDAGLHGDAAGLERLIDEFAAADGLDRRRAEILRRDILDRAADTGLLAESGVAPDAPDDVALARLDAYLCDVKDFRIRDGLHVFGVAPSPERRDMLLAALARATSETSVADRLDSCAAAERGALLAALDGRFVTPGPAGAPTRGRADVLPTGRNMFSVDPRAVPTRSAVTLAEAQMAEFLKRHLQDHGDWPRRLMIDLWGSATMRTGGEDFSLALLLMGVRPLWDDASGRVTGFRVVPLAVLDRPRVDVTLRISGLFRDAFERQILLFDEAVRAVAARDEAADWNPLAASAKGLAGPALRHATARIYGAAPGTYGAGDTLDREPAEIARAYVAASSYAYGQTLDGVEDATGFAARVGATEALLHTQDHAEIDLLDGLEHAAHEGGFAAAAAQLGGAPALYHIDTSDPATARIRTVAEEVARVVRGRAANPAWIAGMMRHGYRGAAEIARSLDALAAFAASLPERFDRQFDLMFDATLGDDAIERFLRAENPAARAAMAARFADARRRDLWRPRRNDLPE